MVKMLQPAAFVSVTRYCGKILLTLLINPAFLSHSENGVWLDDITADYAVDCADGTE